MKQLILPNPKNQIQRLQRINKILEIKESPSIFYSLRKKYTLNLPSGSLNLGKKTLIMGIINASPDSFSADGQKNNHHNILKIEKFIKEGADIIDIGGESSRPGAEPISAHEELNRIIPIITKSSKKFKIPVSVDTYKSEVARHALDAGAAIINNIMGCRPDKTLIKMIRNYNAAVVLMHLRGTPKTMQNDISFKNVINDIIKDLKKSIEMCLEIGIKSDKIIIDPGIGFGKTIEHNLTIINQLPKLQKLDYPILVGPSRKSFIGKVLKREVNQRLLGTTACVCASIMRGAHIVRVHDVKEIKETAVMTDAILNEKIMTNQD